MSTVIAFDTLDYANKLKAANVPAEQAELQARAIKEVLEKALYTAEIATKTDVQNETAFVRRDMEALEQRLDARIAAQHTKLFFQLCAAMTGIVSVIGTLIGLLFKFI